MKPLFFFVLGFNPKLIFKMLFFFVLFERAPALPGFWVLAPFDPQACAGSWVSQVVFRAAPEKGGEDAGLTRWEVTQGPSPGLPSDCRAKMGGNFPAAPAPGFPAGAPFTPPLPTKGFRLTPPREEPATPFHPRGYHRAPHAWGGMMLTIPSMVRGHGGRTTKTPSGREPGPKKGLTLGRMTRSRGGKGPPAPPREDPPQRAPLSSLSPRTCFAGPRQSSRLALGGSPGNPGVPVSPARPPHVDKRLVGLGVFFPSFSSSWGDGYTWVSHVEPALFFFPKLEH